MKTLADIIRRATARAATHPVSFEGIQYAKYSRETARQRMILLDASKRDTGWRTIHGVHVHIDEGGKIDRGPKALIGKNHAEASTHAKRNGHDRDDAHVRAEKAVEARRAGKKEFEIGMSEKKAKQALGDDHPMFNQGEPVPSAEQEGGPAAEKPPEKPAEKEVVAYKTSQGSHYHLDDAGRTTRHKTVHAGHDPKDKGRKAKSEATHYLDPEHATVLGAFQGLSAKHKGVVVQGDSVHSVFYDERTSAWRKLDGPFPLQKKPAVGSSPLELWQGHADSETGKTLYKNWHPGNPITEVEHAEHYSPHATTDDLRMTETAWKQQAARTSTAKLKASLRNADTRVSNPDHPVAKIAEHVLRGELEARGVKVIDNRHPDKQAPAEPLAATAPAAPPAPAADPSTYDKAVAHAEANGRASVGSLQSKLGVGYIEANRLLNQMHANGVTRPTRGESHELVEQPKPDRKAEPTAQEQFVGNETREESLNRYRIARGMGLDVAKPKHGSEMGYLADADQKAFEHHLDREYEKAHGAFDENDHAGMTAAGYHADYGHDDTDAIGPLLTKFHETTPAAEARPVASTRPVQATKPANDDDLVSVYKPTGAAATDTYQGGKAIPQPAEQPKKPKKKVDDTPQDGKRASIASIERRLLAHHEARGGDDVDRDMDNAGPEYEQVSSDRNRTFKGESMRDLPGEVRTFLQGRAHLRKHFHVTTDSSKAGGSDTMGQLGVEKYTSAVERMVQGKTNRAMKTAHQSDDPEIRFLASVYEHSDNGAGVRDTKDDAGNVTHKGDKRVILRHMPTDKLETGHSFTIHGEHFHVVEPDEGHKVIVGPSHYPDLPVDAATYIPIDHDSLHIRKPAKPTREADDVIPFSRGTARDRLTALSTAINSARAHSPACSASGINGGARRRLAALYLAILHVQPPQ